MKNRRFAFCFYMTLSVTIFGCAKSFLPTDSQPNTLAVASPTPPSNENQAEPPPPAPLTPKPAPSLNPNSSETDAELINATKSENFDEVNRLLASGANPNAFFKVSDGALNYYETVLGLAVDKKNADIAQLLLEKGANANKHSFDGNQPPVLWGDNFSRAANNEDVITMKLLANFHADLNGNKDNPPVITRVKNTEVLNFLIKQGFDIDAKDFEGNSILVKAIFDNNAELVKAVLKYNPDLNQKTGESAFTDYEKLTLLQLAERYASKEIVQELKKAGAKK